MIPSLVGCLAVVAFVVFRPGETAVVDFRPNVKPRFDVFKDPSSATFLTQTFQAKSGDALFVFDDEKWELAWRKFQKDGGWVVRSSDLGHEPGTVLILPRDLSERRIASMRESLFGHDRQGVATLILKSPGGERKTITGKQAEERILTELESPGHARAAWFGDTVFLEIVPVDAAGRRRVLLSEAKEQLDPMVSRIREGGERAPTFDQIHAVENVLQAVFERAAAENLRTDGFALFEICRVSALRHAAEAKTSTDAASVLENYAIGLVASVDPIKCSVVVNASRGDGASISYAKEVDAENGVFTLANGKTQSVPLALERARYTFRAMRDGKVTGSKDENCSDPKETALVVTIDEES